MVLIILCVDGFDPDYAKENGFTMPYERKLTIPPELYFDGMPHTLLVWPSIFTGEIQRHKYFLKRMSTRRKGLRKLINNYLKNRGIRWTRDGTDIRIDKETSFTSYDPEIKKSILDDYHSYTFNLPGVNYGFLMGGNIPYYRNQHRTFQLLASVVGFADYEIAAIYTAILDQLGHYNLDLKQTYSEIIDLAKSLGKTSPVLLVSDHGTINGEHTEHAYLGSNLPLKASTVLEVRNDIESILRDELFMVGKLEDARRVAATG